MTLKKLLIIFIALAMTFTMAACSTGGNTESKEDVKIVFWNSGVYPTVDENDKSKKKEDFYIFQAVKRFEDQNPGIKVEVQDTTGGTEQFTKFQTASIAKNGPDVTHLWSGNYMLKYKQYIEPLDDYLTDDFIDSLSGWEAVTEGFEVGEGKIYGVPSGTDGTVGILYNKKLLAAAGVDPVADRPQNITEFLAMLEKLKSSGVIPLGMGDSHFFNYAAYWIAQTITPAGIGDLVNGKTNFSDPELVEIIEGWSKIYSEELVTLDQAAQLFHQGKVAMADSGYWGIADARKALGDDLGMMKMPDFAKDVPIKDGGVGGTGGSFIVTNYSKHKEESVKFLTFLNSKEEQVNRLESGEGSLTHHKDVDISAYTDEQLLIQNQEWANEDSTIFWPDNIFPSELTDEIWNLFPVAFTGQLSAKDFMEKLDKKRDDILESSQ